MEQASDRTSRFIQTESLGNIRHAWQRIRIYPRLWINAKETPCTKDIRSIHVTLGSLLSVTVVFSVKGASEIVHSVHRKLPYNNLSSSFSVWVQNKVMTVNSLDSIDAVHRGPTIIGNTLQAVLHNCKWKISTFAKKTDGFRRQQRWTQSWVNGGYQRIVCCLQNVGTYYAIRRTYRSEITEVECKYSCDRNISIL